MKKKKMTNLDFIGLYLKLYPGSRYSDITKALCNFRGRNWTRGYYSRYFSSWHNWHKSKVYAGYAWTKSGGRWYLSGNQQQVASFLSGAPSDFEEIFKTIVSLKVRNSRDIFNALI